MKPEFLELIGYASSVLILISLLMTSVVKFRVINGIGSIIFTAYAILIHSYPTAVLNGCLVLVDLWFLIKVLRTRLECSVSKAFRDESAVRRFLTENAGDIASFFPDWQAQAAQADQVYVVYCGMTMAGILAGTAAADGSLTVLLDYATPQFRDCSVGKALYPALAQQGFRKLQVETENTQHRRYLRKMGFVADHNTFIKTL